MIQNYSRLKATDSPTHYLSHSAAVPINKILRQNWVNRTYVRKQDCKPTFCLSTVLCTEKQSLTTLFSAYETQISGVLMQSKAEVDKSGNQISQKPWYQARCDQLISNLSTRWLGNTHLNKEKKLSSRKSKGREKQQSLCCPTF